MSSTEKARAAVEAFFDDQLAELGRHAAAGGIRLADVGARLRAQASYYGAVDDGVPPFEAAWDGSSAALHEALTRRWEREALAPLASPLATLAEAIGEDDAAALDISPFLYVLF